MPLDALDRVEVIVRQINERLIRLNRLAATAPYPFVDALAVWRGIRQGDIYLAQTQSPAGAQVAAALNQVKTQLQSWTPRLRVYLHGRWAALEAQVEAAGSLTAQAVRRIVQELNDQQELIDSQLVEAAGRTELLAAWNGAFARIDSVIRGKVA